jgi:hypothetical protein
MWDTLLYGHRIPEIHAVRQPDGSYDIIDGKQRLLTLMKILDNEIPLKRASASDEVRTYLENNNISKIFFKDLSKESKNKLYNTSLSVAEYSNVNEDILVILFQKLNAGKPLTEFQKCIANNILVRTRYTDAFEKNPFLLGLFTDKEIGKNEDEIMLVRLLSSLNCGAIEDLDGLEQRNLYKIIEKVDLKSLIKTREMVFSIIDDMTKLGITSEDVRIINKTWYPLLFKFFNEEVSPDLRKYFKDFLPKIKIPAQRGQESSKAQCIQRYNSILSDWEDYLKTI